NRDSRGIGVGRNGGYRSGGVGCRWGRFRRHGRRRYKMLDQPLAFTADMLAQEHDNLLDLFREMPDGFEPLRFDAADERDALGVFEEVEPFVTEATPHFVGGLQCELAFLLPREPNGFE